MRRDGLRISYVPLGSLERWPRNPKLHDIPRLKESMSRWGFTMPIMIDGVPGKLIAGHGRQEALSSMKKDGASPPAHVHIREDGEWMVPAITGNDFKDDREAELYLVADNRLTEIGGWSPGDLSSIFKDFESLDLSTIGFDDDAIARVIEAAEEGLDNVQLVEFQASKSQIEEDEVPDLPSDPVSKPGDVWVMGKHRLLCGDSTDGKSVLSLFGGDSASLLATDPPYGIGYGVTSGAPDSINLERDEIAGDEDDGPKLQAFLESVFRVALSVIRPDSAWYIWHAQRLTQAFFAPAAAAAAAAADVLIHRQIIWVKPSLIMGTGDFHWRHELCFYGWRRGHRAPWYGDRKQTTVWEISRDTHLKVHPTQKPVEIFARSMNLSTKEGELVYEPFAGSGTQFIAAEKLNRICYGIEIDPRFCDLIVERWESASGGKAKRKRIG